MAPLQPFSALSSRRLLQVRLACPDITPAGDLAWRGERGTVRIAAFASAART
ncbi:hypothetical protein [Streptomyces sp. NPDC049099]|uniref:hypothetical protein n=1 Tax=unclassified Streptomyces TaxID=2593676 RepID=UPI0034351117